MPHKDLPFEPKRHSAVSMVDEWSSRGVRLTGTCPQCGGETEASFTKVIGGGPGDAVIADLPALDHKVWPKGETVTVVCDCGLEHKGRPDEDFGCGAYWKVSL